MTDITSHNRQQTPSVHICLLHTKKIVKAGFPYVFKMKSPVSLLIIISIPIYNTLNCVESFQS